MERRRYLVAYDIADDRRLRDVYREMLGWGSRLQDSVYLCDLTRPELIKLRRKLLELIDRDDDSVAIFDLGVPTSSRAVVPEILGRPPNLPQQGPAIY
ncbi:CRISPR-associated endonuclease Cas2 [Tepidiforma thermophila]|uniref:CRISPR-associated endoribonuclease Cas2 n=1 Tax=Tepidiforma thermophila (strain KCTC 52669 / CGMCC 1.13589 / G233) TaxID=2761530 RepID=A0A2A9HD45_TEPT2|nr:CRISPR-associated endonuclease Cas2 [Tepidiforma thermophila]PFG73081.1 CRISPR-associated protein Cas2 [Tepidiforma thermophila]